MFYKKLSTPFNWNEICHDIRVYRSAWKNTALYYEDDRDYLSIGSLEDYLMYLGVYKYIRSVGHTVIYPREQIPIHVDNYESYIWSLTLPFRNPEDTYNCFYEDEGKLPFTDHGDRGYGPYAINKGWLHPNPDKAVQIDQVEVDCPMFLNTSVPHNVINTGEKIREALVVRMSLDFDIGKFHGTKVHKDSN